MPTNSKHNRCEKPRAGAASTKKAQSTEHSRRVLYYDFTFTVYLAKFSKRNLAGTPEHVSLTALPVYHSFECVFTEGFEQKEHPESSPKMQSPNRLAAAAVVGAAVLIWYIRQRRQSPKKSDDESFHTSTFTDRVKRLRHPEKLPPAMVPALGLASVLAWRQA